MSPSVGYGGNGPAAGGAGHEVPAILLHPIPECDLHSLASLVHVQLGQIVRNSAVAVVMINCSKLKQFHCNSCPDLRYIRPFVNNFSSEALLVSSKDLWHASLANDLFVSQGRGPSSVLDARRLPGCPGVLLHLRGTAFDLRRVPVPRRHLPGAWSPRQPHPLGRRLRRNTECCARRSRE